MNRGIATFTLDYGKCPPWLFERMVKLGRGITEILVSEYGSAEFVKRIGDPVWFQALGTVLAFDWNASGLTTILTAALKEGIRGQEKNLGLYICGGKGKTSLKTPEQILSASANLSLTKDKAKNLVYNSKMTAKVDSSLVQDSYELYHHAFFLSKDGAWSVVQQGMNKQNQTARRYHWHSDNVKDLVVEPHSGIISQAKNQDVLNMTAKDSHETRDLSVEMTQGNFNGLMKDVQILRKHSSALSRMTKYKISENQLTLLELSDQDFTTHPVINEDFSKSSYLEKILWKVCDEKPKDYADLLYKQGVGPKTIRALALVSEIIYGAKPSYEDPARYSFAHGGKDIVPYPVDIKTYDESIEMIKKALVKMKIERSEKKVSIDSLGKFQQP